MFKVEIKGNEKVEEGIKKLCSDELLSKVGYVLTYVKENDKYILYVTTYKISATLGLKVGKKLILSEMEKAFKKIDPNCEIKEVK
jgi:hypothetical protein